jgi:choline dehydrogenase-like flavoprotein
VARLSARLGGVVRLRADGSLFPTSIGANPQLSIYAVAARLAEGIAADLGPARAAAR